MTTIATWNVNSIKARLPRVLEWLDEFSPDIVLLQELKCVQEAFPHDAIADKGYNIAVVGQKTYNGVAILSKSPMEVDCEALPPLDEEGEDDPQARYMEGVIGSLRVASLYLPNGNPTTNDDGTLSDKYTYKLRWMKRLKARVAHLLALEENFVLGGDYNLCPTDDDVHDPAAFAEDALCRPQSRACWRALMNLGLTDALHAMDARAHHYSYWDYQGGAWQKDNGLRIDHLLLSPQTADLLHEAGIDKTPRGRDRPSDHTPVWCRLDGVH